MAERVHIERRSRSPKGWVYKVETEALFLTYAEIEVLRDFLFSVKSNLAARDVDAWLDKNED